MVFLDIEHVGFPVLVHIALARTSAFQYKGKSPDDREVGRKLGVRAMLEGSVGRCGDLNVVPQLIRASDGYHLWSDAYDTGLAEPPSVEASRTGDRARLC